jgi:lipoprotein-releasing system permease protein
MPYTCSTVAAWNYRAERVRSSHTFSIAIRYTLAWRKGYLSSFLSLLSMLGLILAIALLILVLSVMNGFDREMRDNILALVPQLTIKSWLPPEDWQASRDQLLKHPQVIAAAPYVELQGMMVKGNQVDTVLAFGISAVQEEKAGGITRAVPAQQWRDFMAEPEGMLLGKALAKRLSLEAGDRATFIVPGVNFSTASAQYRHLQVSGLLDSGTEIDESAAFVHLVVAAELAGKPGQVDGYRLQLIDLFAAPRVGWELVNAMPPGFYATDWTMTHGNLYSAIQMSRDLVGILLLSIIAIAAFNVVSSLVLVVVDKRSDIAILRALGASPGDINRIFLQQGLIIAVVGTALGTLLGVIASLWVTEIVAGIEGFFNITFLDTDVYPIGYMPSDLRLADVLMINAVAAVLCFLAALYPARRAAKLPPAEALRHD